MTNLRAKMLRHCQSNTVVLGGLQQVPSDPEAKLPSSPFPKRGCIHPILVSVVTKSKARNCEQKDPRHFTLLVTQRASWVN